MALRRGVGGSPVNGGLLDIVAALPRSLRPSIERLKASPEGSRLATGVFWSVCGAVVPRGMMLVATMVVARLLGTIVYGELGIILATVHMLGAFAGFGLGLTATKHVAELRQIDPARAGRILGLSGVVALISGGLMATGLFAFAPWLSEHVLHASHLVRPLRLGALILLFSAVNGAQVGALSGFEAFKKIALVNTLAALLSFPMLIAGAYWGGIEGAVAAMALNFGVSWLFNHVALRQVAAQCRVPVRLKGCMSESSVLWRFSVPAVLAGALTGVVHWGCGALLVNQPNGYSEMGIFSAVNQWFLLLLFIPGVLGSVVLPILADHLGQDKAAKSKRTLALAIKTNLIVVAPVAIVAAAASPFIMGLYGAAFVTGWPTLAIMSLTAILVAVNAPVGQFLAASGRMWVGFTMNAGWAFVLLSGTLLLVGYGSVGLAGAIAVAYLLHTLWVLLYVRSLVRN